MPPDGATITAYEWDLTNNNVFGDVSGETLPLPPSPPPSNAIGRGSDGRAPFQ